MSFLRTCVALFAVSLLIIALSVLSSRCEVGRPAVAIDFEIAPTPEISVIDSVYSGYARYLYAFLVINEVPGGHICAYDLGYRLVSPDSSVVNLGFTRLDGWQSLNPGRLSFPSGIEVPGRRLPAAVGFWTLELTGGPSSRGRLSLIPNPENHRLDMTLLDSSAQAVRPAIVHSGTIRSIPVGSNPFANVAHVNEWGRTFRSSRDKPHAPGQVIVRFVQGTIKAGDEAILDPHECTANVNLKRMSARFGFAGVRRVFSNLPDGGSAMTGCTGRPFVMPDLKDIYVMYFPSEIDVWTVVDSLRAIPECIYAEPNYLGSYCREPDDHYYQNGEQWNIDRINMPDAWEKSVGLLGIMVGILDTGIDYRHLEFGNGWGPGHKVYGGWNYNDHNDDFLDAAPASHGTKLAGIVAAYTDNNGDGIAGIAGGWHPAFPGCRLHASRVSTWGGDPNTEAIAEAILDAVDREDTHVLNMSFGLGGDTPLELVWDAMAVAHAADIIMVASKGNEGNDEMNIPADSRSDWVIAVGGSSHLGAPERRFYRAGEEEVSSNYGCGIDVLAPGTQIWSTTRTDTTFLYQESQPGTSWSAAHVSGIVALIRSLRQDLCTDDVEGIVCAATEDIVYDDEMSEGEDMNGYDVWSGWGRVDANLALEYARQDGDYEIHRFTHTGGSVVWSSPDKYLMEFRVEPPPLNLLMVKQYEVQAEITYPFAAEGFVHVWGRGINASVGWSPWSPNYEQGYCKLLPETKSSSSCTFRTYVYEVWSLGGDYYGWFPCEPQDVVFAYSVLAEKCASVEPRSPHAGRRVNLWVEVSPNPSRREADIRFSIPDNGNVVVRIFDVEGRLVRELYSGEISQGLHSLKWYGRDEAGVNVSPGIFFCEVLAGQARATEKMVLTQ